MSEVHALFEACLDLDEGAVARALSAAPPAVAAEVRALLEHDRAAGDFLAAPVEPPMPARVGRFEIGARLGEGGMGVVYAARDPHLGRDVAIKVLGGFRLDPARRSQLLDEARALAQISHPHVVQVFEADEQDAQVFVVMELVRGETLRAHLGTARPWRETLALLRAVGAGVEAIHRAGLVHRDIKPENVLVGEDGRARILDLGLAAIAGGSQEALRGTPRYMAPEQWAGAAPDARGDQFAFAVTAFEALCGRPPFADTRAIVPPRFAATIPAELGPPLLRALSPRPEERFATMGELLRALDAALARHDAALSIGRPTRIAMTVGLLLIPPVGYLVAKHLIDPRASATTLLPMSVGMVTPVLILAAVLWRKLERNIVSRTVRLLLVAEPLLLLTSRLLAAVMGETVAAAFARDMVLLAAPLVMAAPVVARTLLLPAAVAIGLSFAAALHPDHAIEAFVSFTTLLYGTFFVLWVRSDVAGAAH